MAEKRKRLKWGRLTAFAFLAACVAACSERADFDPSPSSDDEVSCITPACLRDEAERLLARAEETDSLEYYDSLRSEAAFQFMQAGDNERALSLADETVVEDRTPGLHDAWKSLRAQLALRMGEAARAERLFAELEARLLPRAYSDGIGAPRITRVLIMDQLEQTDNQHGEPSFRLGYWIDAAFGRLQARDAQGECAGQRALAEDLEVAISYHIEELHDILHWGPPTFAYGTPRQAVSIWSNRLAEAYAMRASVRDRLDLGEFAARDRQRVDFVQQNVPGILPPQIVVEPIACFAEN